jgi:hypothetical protein
MYLQHNFLKVHLITDISPFNLSVSICLHCISVFIFIIQKQIFPIPLFFIYFLKFTKRQLVCLFFNFINGKK